MSFWRALSAVAPEADLMGGLVLAALIVNVTSALVLSRFREGDANVRAVWLFSRNDALANVAVIVAAGLVAWTDSAWPDLAVARSEEHTSELQSLMRISYAVFCLKKKKTKQEEQLTVTIDKQNRRETRQ